MVKDHSDSERGTPLPPHGLLFPINSKGSFICTIPQTGLHIPRVVEHWLEREIAQWVHLNGSIHQNINRLLGCQTNGAVGWNGYRDANPVPTSVWSATQAGVLSRSSTCEISDDSLDSSSSSSLVLTCTFRASCCSTRPSWAHTPVINWVVCLG